MHSGPFVANPYHTSPPSYNNCQDDPNPSAAPNYPVRIANIDKVAETITLQNVTAADAIDLTGWQMCSITGNQHHPDRWHARARRDEGVREHRRADLEQQ
jgi:hypothetical protein